MPPTSSSSPVATPRGRQPPISCSFCRARKLRCNQPRPCTNCVSRGRICDPTNNNHSATEQQDSNTNNTHNTTSITTIKGTPPPQLRYQQQLRSPTHHARHDSLAAEIQEPKGRAQLSESRANESSNSPDAVSSRPHHRHHDHHYFSNLTPTTPSRSATSPAAANTPASLSSISSLSSIPLGQSEHVLAYLEDVSRGRNELPVANDSLETPMVFAVKSIHSIPEAPTHVSQLGRATRCIYLPRHAETLVLLDLYVSEISYIQHVLYLPSLPQLVDTVYGQIEDHGSVTSGLVVLLLSIIATATHVWSPSTARERSGPASSTLFASAQYAYAQTAMWIQTTRVVLAAAQESSPPILETVQGVLTLSFLVANLEGPSQRFRSLVSTGLFLGRELNLHRIDSNSSLQSSLQSEDVDLAPKDPVRAEVSRRVWWYMAATDWLLATRYGGLHEGIYQTNPRQMEVKKPRNINDIEAASDSPGLPRSEPTDNSYFLERIRLAEIARGIVDCGIITAAANSPGYYSHVVAMDFELDQMIRDMPRCFHLNQYPPQSCNNNSTVSNNLFIQAYLLNSHIQIQRCRLHLAFLTTGPRDSSAYASSRATCLESARCLLEAENQLLQSDHRFMRIRLRLSGMLYGIFIAAIVFLTDACLNCTAQISHDEETRYSNLARALKMIEDAKHSSLAAATVHESLMQILQRHRVQHNQQQQQQFSMAVTSTRPATIPVVQQEKPGHTTGRISLWTLGSSSNGTTAEFRVSEYNNNDITTTTSTKTPQQQLANPAESNLNTLVASDMTGMVVDESGASGDDFQQWSDLLNDLEMSLG